MSYIYRLWYFTLHAVLRRSSYSLSKVVVRKRPRPTGRAGCSWLTCSRFGGGWSGSSFLGGVAWSRTSQSLHNELSQTTLASGSQVHPMGCEVRTSNVVEVYNLGTLVAATELINVVVCQHDGFIDGTVFGKVMAVR